MKIVERSPRWSVPNIKNVNLQAVWVSPCSTIKQRLRERVYVWHVTVVRNRSFVSSVIKAKLQISLDSQVCTTVAMPMFNCSLYVFKNAQQVQSLHFLLEALPGVCERMSKMFAALFCVFFGLLNATVVLCGCCVCCVCMLLVFVFITHIHKHTYTHIPI